uniref:Acyltransferase 3 domain-containing protein n=1 Tax=Chromera velia CCMP2878 TaxID=1169474 RepID=A0A0G4FHG8_9ALVE|eukprot:Cvel_3349.t1-p1 / transcript=Cvel_3349.t1 / gene=Cvel_3349 / organism=Chromera_velia_CCMP2878 / gene_product=O-acetyltransferase OatA, putative / transcript_product=O-acetyltransferase OatA, putative / location=Cvel_scaffold133:97681-104067(+) / protein_length=836 / sequence_SO=supercontig / SO=protein_coding / is_pseudo=false
MPPPQTSESLPFRTDVEAVRAIALLLVLLYHSDVLGSGFLGVDIFFVISGFVITRNLLHESKSHSRISLLRFYAARSGRLFPASHLLFMSFLLYSFAFSDRFQQYHDSKTAALACGFGLNFFLAMTSLNYLQEEDVLDIPFLHFWSLNVEEQFYFVWPCMLSLCSGSLSFVTAGCVVVLVLSFSLSVALTGMAPSWAFYSPFTRAWQFVVGGLCAVLSSTVSTPPSLQLPLQVAALVLFGVTLMVVDETTPWPGWAALLPTLVTTLFIFGFETPNENEGHRYETVSQEDVGDGGTAERDSGDKGCQWTVFFARVANCLRAGLCNPLLLFVGKVSYSVYLWHWPLLVFTFRQVTASPLLKVVVCLAAFVPSWVSFRLLETPIRKLAKKSRSPGRVALLALLSVVLVVGMNLALCSYSSRVDLPASDSFTAIAPSEPLEEGGQLIDGVTFQANEAASPAVGADGGALSVNGTLTETSADQAKEASSATDRADSGALSGSTGVTSGVIQVHKSRPNQNPKSSEVINPQYNPLTYAPNRDNWCAKKLPCDQSGCAPVESLSFCAFESLTPAKNCRPLSPKALMEEEGPILVAFGDSHLYHLLGRVFLWAQSRSLKLRYSVHSGCPAEDTATLRQCRGRGKGWDPFKGCESFQKNWLKFAIDAISLGGMSGRMIVLLSSGLFPETPTVARIGPGGGFAGERLSSAESIIAESDKGWVRTLSQTVASKVPVMIIADNPHAPQNLQVGRSLLWTRRKLFWNAETHWWREPSGLAGLWEILWRLQAGGIGAEQRRIPGRSQRVWSSIPLLHSRQSPPKHGHLWASHSGEEDAETVVLEEEEEVD